MESVDRWVVQVCASMHAHAHTHTHTHTQIERRMQTFLPEPTYSPRLVSLKSNTSSFGIWQTAHGDFSHFVILVLRSPH